MKKREFTEGEIKDIKYLYAEEGINSLEIGKKYNCSGIVIRNLLRKEKININCSGQKYKGGKNASNKRYYNTNKENILRKYKEYASNKKGELKEYHKKWRGINKEKIRKRRNLYEKNKKEKDPTYKLTSVFRNSINAAIKEQNIKKTKGILKILGYTKQDLIKHIENLFEEGMSFENYGKWHIDHIIPISKFKYESIEDEEFKECWSLPNLRPCWAYENLSKHNHIVAHQYKIRERKKKEEINNMGFDVSKCSLQNSEIKEIDREECEKIIKEYEWLGYLPKYTKYHFGLFFKIENKFHLGGVLAYQPEYGDNMGIWNKYGYTGKIIQLSRGVCLWWTPKNSASFFISRANKWLRKNTHYKIVTATVDSSAGEIGTIYQSLNWVYTGTMNGNLLKSGKERIRYGYLMNNKIYNQRHIRSMIGTAKREDVMKKFPDIKIINMGRKKRYFTFIGTKSENKKYKASIEFLVKPYQKR